ncbi:S-type pyocin domain-containing protein [Raoultella sp. WB_B2P2-3]|uniref:S-type pyocin domain-containing protein n=1 Tax=Raoultella scottii TaxID=3040937 RepID=UPI002F936F32
MPLPAGAGSDKVPGRDISMMAAQARLFTAGKVSIEPGMKSVNLPVRGFISTNSDGRQSVNFVKTGSGGVSATVPVLSAVRDKATGLDKITVPAVTGAPSRTILVNPVPVGPTAPSHTGSNTPAPVTPVHTGTEVKQADSIVTTTFPAADMPPLQDFIYWQPDATGTGVEPIYVILNSPYGETNAKGKYSGRPYHTDSAGGPIQNLDWKTAVIDRAGVDKVKLHTGRFESTPENKVMIDRLEKILKGELQVTDTDKRFYTHEIRELERYRNLGIKDGEVPKSVLEQKSVWNNTHTATLEDYKINEKEQALYTDEALQAAYEQELKEALGGNK